MALIHAQFYSQSLMRSVPFCAFIPIEKPAQGEDALKKSAQFQKGLKTLYLLHGLSGCETDWITLTGVRSYAAKKNLALIMPSAENRFYIDGALPNERYGTFVGEELVNASRALFNLSERREDTFIAGLSMGGAGAIRSACLYPATFSAAAGLSSAFLSSVHLAGNNPSFSQKWADSVFGSVQKMEQTYKNAVKSLKEGTKRELYPHFYLGCGTEDFLIEANRDFHCFLSENGIEHRYEESPGIHDWNFWDAGIKKVIDWLCPDAE